MWTVGLEIDYHHDNAREKRIDNSDETFIGIMDFVSDWIRK